MRLEAEATIPLDKHRSVWIHLVALDVEPDDVEKTASALAEQTAAQALAAYEHASQRVQMAPDAAAVVSRASGHPSGLAPSERPPREDDPESMRTFGDDEGEPDAD